MIQKWTVTTIVECTKMKENILISVIIPVFNMEEYIGFALKSVLAQSLTNIEILCVDDGSTDDSQKIIKSYQEKDKRIILLIQKNLGAGKARNYALNVARGEYISFLDADDYLPDPCCLNDLYLNAHNNKALICGGNHFIDKNGILIKDPNRFDSGPFFTHKGYVKFENFQYEFCYWKYIYKSSFLRKERIVFPSYLRGQDPPFLASCMIKAKEFYALPRYSYVYRVSHKSINWNQKKLVDTLSSERDLLLLSIEHNLKLLHKRIAIRLFKLWGLIILQKQNSYSTYKAYINAIRLIDNSLLYDFGLKFDRQTKILNNFMHNEIQAICNFVLENAYPYVYLYCANDLSIMLCRLLLQKGISVKYIFDQNDLKHGTILKNVNIVSFNPLLLDDNAYLIIATDLHYDSIKNFVEEKCANKKITITRFFCYSY